MQANLITLKSLVFIYFVEILVNFKVNLKQKCTVVHVFCKIPF